MRAILQRTKEARVDVDEEAIGAIGPGLVIFICAMQGDSIEEARYLAGKAARMRLFADEDGKTKTKDKKKAAEPKAEKKTAEPKAAQKTEDKKPKAKKAEPKKSEKKTDEKKKSK